MSDKDKSKEELIDELTSLRKELDILQKKKEKEKLDKLRSSIYKKIFLTTSDHFSIISLDNTYIEVNNSYLLAHGLTRDDIVGHQVSEIFGNEVFEKYIQPNIDSCKMGKEVHYNKWFEFPIGQKKFMQVKYHPCYVNSKIKGVIVSSHDVTKLKEKALLLEKTNLEKDKLFSIIAHDLRSPFSGILGFTDLLIRNSNEYSKEKYIEITKVINSLTENTLELLENLLEWANLQRNQENIVIKKLNLNNIISHELPSLREAGILKSITIENKVDSNLQVWANENMLKTIVRNLINNALKFTKRGGTISLNANNEENNVKISITDNGVGIEEARLKTLFQITKHSSTAGTDNEKGTGLGLMLCNEFVKKHGGNIGVKSKLNQGSTFHFTLPNKV